MALTRLRVRPIDDFTAPSLKTILLQAKPDIAAVVGQLKDTRTTAVQSLNFSDEWVDTDAIKWARDHKFLAADAEPVLETNEIPAPEVDPELGVVVAALVQRDASAKRSVSVPSARIKTIDEDKGTAEVIISSDDVDRMKEAVDPEGMIIPKPKRVPLVSSHQYDDLRKQIGDVGRPKKEGKEIIANPKWFVGLGNPEADWAFTLAKLGVAAFSIGFLPQAFEDADLSDEKELANVMEGKRPFRTYTKWELLEVSQVIVPANRVAVQRMVAEGILPKEHAPALLAATPDEKGSAEAQATFEKAMETYKEDVAKAEPPVPDPVTKPRDEHGCEPGYHWNGEECVPDEKSQPEIEVDPSKQIDVLALVQKELEKQDTIDTLVALEVKNQFEAVAVQLRKETVVMVSDAKLSEIQTALETRCGTLVLEAVEKAVSNLRQALKAEAEGYALKTIQETFGPTSAAHTQVNELIAAVMTGVREIVIREIQKAKGVADHYLKA